MKCYYHKNKEASHSCKLCGHPLCKGCIEEIKGQYYCQNCLQKLINGEEKKEKVQYKPHKSPGGAALLSIIPGLGQIYNGQVVKGIGIVFLFASTISLATMYEHEDIFPIFPLLATIIYFGGIVDAYRTAKQLNLRQGLVKDEPIGLIPEGSMWWGIILIIVGLLFLLRNLGVSLYWIRNFWPVIIIALGIYLLRGFFRGSKEAKPEEDEVKKGEEK